MATLYVSEYSSLGTAALDYRMQSALEPSIAEQAITISASPTQSAAFNTQTKYIRVHTDSICSIAFGQNPTAVTTAKRFAANQTEYFGVIPGQGYKLSVIANV